MIPAVSRRDDAVHRRREQRQLEPVGAERPGDVDVVRVARPPRRDDRDVVESVGASRLLASADLNLHDGILGVLADGTGHKTVPSPAGAPQDPRGRRRARRPREARRYAASAGSVGCSTSISPEQPADALAVDQPGAEVLGRLGAAGDPVGKALGGRPAGVAGGDEAGQERVARADRGARLERGRRDASRGTAQAPARPSSGVMRAKQPSPIVMIASRAPRSHISPTAIAQSSSSSLNSWPTSSSASSTFGRDHVGLGAHRAPQRVAVGVDHGLDARAAAARGSASRRCPCRRRAGASPRTRTGSRPWPGRAACR